MSKSKKNAVSFAHPPEPAFLRRIKEQLGYKEGPSVDSKRDDMPECEDEDLKDREDELPTVVVLKPGDLSKEEAEKLGVFADEEDSDDKGPKKIVYKQPVKRSAEEMEEKNKLKKEVTAKKVKNKSLLSFDDEEDDDDENT